MKNAKTKNIKKSTYDLLYWSMVQMTCIVWSFIINNQEVIHNFSIIADYLSNISFFSPIQGLLEFISIVFSIIS